MPSSRGKAWAIIWILLGVMLILRSGFRDRGVIADHLEFGRRLVAAEELYAPFQEAGPLHPVYPPSFGLLTGPVSLAGERLARLAWVFLQVCALGYIGRRLLHWQRELWPALAARSHLLLFVTALLCSRFILRDSHGGGGNLFTLALVIGAFHLDAKGKSMRAGALLGLSLATKPTMILCLPLLWIIGKRRSAFATIGFALALLLLALGLNQHGWAPLDRWWQGSLAYSTMADPYAEPTLGFPPFSWMNQSLRYALARYLGVVPAGFAALVPGGLFPGLGLETSTVTLYGRLLSAGLLLSTFLYAWRGRDQQAVRIRSLAAVLCLGLLLSPIAWKAHHVALIPAMFYLVGSAMAGRSWLWYAFAGYGITCVLGEEIIGKELKNQQQSLYLLTLGSLTIWTLCLRLNPSTDHQQTSKTDPWE